MIGATVAIPVLVLVGWGLNLERSGPYDNMVDRLRPEMSKSDMWRELGVPQQAFVRIDGRGERDWYVYKQLGTDYELRVWHENYYGLGDESAGLGGWCVIRPGEADDKIVFRLLCRRVPALQRHKRCNRLPLQLVLPPNHGRLRHLRMRHQRGLHLHRPQPMPAQIVITSSTRPISQK